MKIVIEITEKENEVLQALIKNKLLSASNNYSGFGSSNELREFIKNDLVYNESAGIEGSWIKYALTEKGLTAEYKII